MADQINIEWTDATWNPITGCSVVSPGCTNCYAMKLAGTRLKHHPSRAGLTKERKAGPVWTGEVRFNEAWLDQPLRWAKPRMIFVCAHGDLFAEGVPDEWIDRVFAVMALVPQHTFQVLTKRAERMRAYISDPTTRDRIDSTMNDIAPAHWCSREIEDFGGWPLPNVWLGISAEDQRRADERVPLLLQTPAAVRWVSAEPLIGPIDFLLKLSGGLRWDSLGGRGRACGIDWLVAGGESGKNARPMHPNWVRGLRDQCERADVPFLFKQWGAWSALQDGHGTWPADAGSLIRLTPEGARTDDGWPMQRVGKKLAGRTLDGRIHDEYPRVDEVIF